MNKGENRMKTQSARQAALRAVQELSFVKCELELYLDTHPDCAQALDYYNKTVTALEEAVAAYEAEYGPIRAEHQRGEGWTWINGDWPWYSGMPNTTEQLGDWR